MQSLSGLKPAATLIATLSLAGAFGASLFFADPAQGKTAWMLHTLSMVLWLAAFFLVDGMPHCVRVAPRHWWLGLAACLLLAAAPRLLWLDTFPQGLFFDEADNANYALRILRAPNYWPVYAEWTHLPAHFIYPIAAAFANFGADIDVLRASSAVWGIATVGVMYILLSRSFALPVAFLATLLFAGMRWHLTFSRLGMHGITTPFFVALILLLMDLAIHKSTWLAWASLGLVTGFALCFYVPLRIAPVMVCAALLFHFRNQPVQQTAQRFGLLIASLLIGVLPFAQFAAAQPDVVFRRTAEVSLFTQSPNITALVPAFGRQTLRMAQMLFWQGDPNPRHNLPDAAQLDPIMAALVLMGCALAFARLRRVSARLALISIFLMSLPAVLSVEGESPHALRSLGMLPGLIMLCAFALEWLFQRGTSLPLRTLAPLLVVASININLIQFFAVQRFDPRAWQAHSTMETLVARDVNEHINDHVIVLTPALRFQPVAEFLMKDVSRVQVWDAAQPLKPTHLPGQTIAVWAAPDQFHRLQAEVQKWPNAELEPLRSPIDGAILAWRMRYVP